MSQDNYPDLFDIVIWFAIFLAGFICGQII